MKKKKNKVHPTRSEKISCIFPIKKNANPLKKIIIKKIQKCLNFHDL